MCEWVLWIYYGFIHPFSNSCWLFTCDVFFCDWELENWSDKKYFFIKSPIKIKNKKWKFPNGTLFIFNILYMIISISLLFCCWWDRSFPYRLLDANQSNLSNIYLKHWTLIQNDNLKNNSNKPYIIIEFQIIKDCVCKKKTIPYE